MQKKFLRTFLTTSLLWQALAFTTETQAMQRDRPHYDYNVATGVRRENYGSTDTYSNYTPRALTSIPTIPDEMHEEMGYIGCGMVTGALGVILLIGAGIGATDVGWSCGFGIPIILSGLACVVKGFRVSDARINSKTYLRI